MLKYSYNKNASNESTRHHEDLQQIKDWLIKQRHLAVRTDHQWLLNFLRGCKCSIQRTKEKLDMFYRMRVFAPEYFANRDPLQPDIQEFLRKRHLLLLAATPTNHSLRKTILIRAKRFDPEKCNVLIATAIKVLTMVLDILLMEDESVVKVGLEVVIDLQQITYKHIVQLTPSLLNKLLSIFQAAYPIRLKMIYFINVPKCFEMLLHLLKVFACGKIKDRINFNGKENMPLSFSMILREDVEDETYFDKLASELKIKLESYHSWFLEDAAYSSC